MTVSVDSSARARIVAALLRDSDRVLLCHRSAGRRWYPDVWDLPGGHVEDGETANAALVRELREELGIVIAEPAGRPMREVCADTFEMQIWLVEVWDGTPVNASADEHDAIAWFEETELAHLRLAHESYRAMFAEVLAGRRS
jgi:8-oxo-dGTP diphosphatase